jgi:hypothetical protein
MRDTCGLLIAGQGAARGHRRATGDEHVCREGRGRHLPSCSRRCPPLTASAWLPVSDTGRVHAGR